VIFEYTINGQKKNRIWKKIFKYAIKRHKKDIKIEKQLNML
jgi:hypothetical protein